MKKILTLQYDHQRNIGLDLLRTIAILMVMLLHGTLLLPRHIAHILSYFIVDGVSIFFVLSGFLIGGIFIKLCEKQKKKEIGFSFIFSFWKRRWFRTLPNYYLILTLLVLQSAIFGSGISPEIAKYYLFIQNLSTPHPGFFPEAWSLAVEEWFYILVPVTVIVLYRLFKNLKFERALYIVCFSILLIVSVLRYLKFLKLGITTDFDGEFRKQVIYRLDSIMYGVIAAAVWFYNRDFWNRYRRIFAAVGLVLFCLNHIIQIIASKNAFYMANISFVMEAISVMLLLPSFYAIKLKSKTLKKGITHISIVSYSMYLVNYTIIDQIRSHGMLWFPLYHYMEPYTPNAHTIIWTSKYVIFWFITILISTLLYKYFEYPMTQLRERFR